MILNNKQRELVNRIDCSQCSDRRACDQIRCECPKVNFHTLQVDDISILKSDAVTNVKNRDEVEPGFITTTRKDFEAHQYGNITRCRYKNKILSFFSSEKEVQGHLLFYFSHSGNYYRGFRDKNLTDAALEKQVMSFLYPDNKSFVYSGWHCKFNTADMLFYLYTPSEMEQPAGVRNSEIEVSTPVQAIEFINCY